MKLELIKGDITKENTDIIVCAANNLNLGGGGVDGAITAAAGSTALRERMALGRVETGDAKIGNAGALNAKYIIYAVGPRYSDNRPDLLASAYRKSMELAINAEAESIAFPAVSCGVYGYDSDLGAQIAIDTILEFTGKDIEVHFVLFTDDVYNAFEKYFKYKVGEFLKNQNA